MRRVLVSIAGGLLVMFTSLICWMAGGGKFFVWACSWPALFIHPFFAEPSPDQIIPLVGSYAGIFTTAMLATLTYSLLIYLMLWWSSRAGRLA
jgi:hypothetical protein